MASASWFHMLFGFDENSLEYDDIKSNFELNNTTLTSKVNNKSYDVGKFSTPSLAELRAQAAPLLALQQHQGRLQVSTELGDISSKHGLPENRFAVIQAASQFNCLEFVGPRVTPEMGVTRYSGDHTQGPACAISCGPGTVFRNYFAPVPIRNEAGEIVGEQQGQTKQHQLENLADFNKIVGNVPAGRYFEVVGGYTLADDQKLRSLNAAMKNIDEDSLRQSVRIGVQYDAQVTSTNWGYRLVSDREQQVTQIYASACAVAYNRSTSTSWAPLATLILEAAYEATLWAALINAHNHSNMHGSRRVFLTALGGGVFGNSATWIARAMERAFTKFRDVNLDVRVVWYSLDHADKRVDEVIAKFQ